FGTSGIREYVRYLEDIKCYAVAEAIISYLNNMGEPATIALAGDFRPSTPRIMLTQMMGALNLGSEVVYGGNVPTPAIVYYGMYRGQGAIPSAMVTASHCAVLPLEEEQNGIKPNRTTGEVLKEDERRILKHVREFMEIEFMMRQEQSMFEKKGGLKDQGKLSASQSALLKKAIEIMKVVNKEAEEMYIKRYTDAFGKIFDENDTMAFIEHMAVGRDIVKEIFGKTGLGADIEAYHRNEDWEEGLIVDTEDIKPKLEGIVKEIAREHWSDSKKLKGIFTTDGDSDRPALFEENGTFVYGDKFDYFACEYIRKLKSNKNKKMFVAVTATVSDAVIRRMKSIGIEVAKVKIGSPYVVKAMEDRLERAKQMHEEVVVCGFERNGGFLLGSDIILDNDKIVKALPTRDAVLPLICAFHTAKEEGKTISELVNDRFSGEYASFGWSGLIESSTIDPKNEEYTNLCKKYTAVMGQAIMRSFSPRDLNIVEVVFEDNGSVTYLRNDGESHNAGAESDFAQDMKKIKTTLEEYFGEDKGLEGGIVKIDYLDGVRMFFGNKEVIHMRPSGNSPQWRIYTEATTLDRAKEMVEFRLPVYPQIIKAYLEVKKQYEGMRIKPKNNDEMKKIFDGVFDITADEWKTWEMRFGGKSEHRLEEGIIFGQNNASVSFYQTKIYDLEKGKLEWLPAKSFQGNELSVTRTITWDRNKGTLTCAEKWSDGREVSVILEGPDAWLEVGRGIDKNIPMGKFQDMPFPVISDKAKTYFREKGVYWFDLFDVSVESEFTVEAPMWAHNFNFEKAAPTTGAGGIGAMDESSLIKSALKPVTTGELTSAQEFYVKHMIDNLKIALRKIKQEDPENKMLLGVNMQIGGDASNVYNLLLQRISELQSSGEFEGLLTVRGKNAEALAAKTLELVKGTKGLSMSRAVLVSRQVDLEGTAFKEMRGQAVIAGIEDRGATEETYLPILETISIALGVASNADYAAIKSIYDLISAEGTNLSQDDFNRIMKDKIILITPRAIRVDARAIYERALEVLTKA
ncbi:MAG: hypothetical protein PHW46_04835, partial [Candidatus Omnitrophica bacterium]|nr:hypothetical protein [Candidatus Omnitrophota bacterium]